jgi:NADP-dependent 3-hydroxy acid dehydrogenase YdfG
LEWTRDPGALPDGADVRPFVTNLADTEALAAAVAEAGITRLDVLVNSAGVADERPFDSFTRQDWRDSFEVNVFAVADLTARLLPALRAAHGIVVMINSGSGTFSYPLGAVYTGTKFALRTMADCLREEERDRGVRVTSVHPGFVSTDMGHRLRQEHGTEGDEYTYVTPETVASAVRQAVSAPETAQLESIVVRPARRPV